MNCPVCGKEMEKGHVITKNSIGLFFMPERKTSARFIRGGTSRQMAALC
ncbi:MAG: PF20097 family protein [Dysosmobacter welbionis]